MSDIQLICETIITIVRVTVAGCVVYGVIVGLAQAAFVKNITRR